MFFTGINIRTCLCSLYHSNKDAECSETKRPQSVSDDEPEETNFRISESLNHWNLENTDLIVSGISGSEVEPKEKKTKQLSITDFFK